MGQPILLGHHSENRHRRDLNRIDSLMHKSIEEIQKSEYYSEKASRLTESVSNLENREFLGNRIAKSNSEIAKHSKFLSADHPKLLHAKDKLEYWKKSMNDIELKMKENGFIIPSSESIKIGDLIQYIGWYPVVRVNKKTVTVSHWLNIATFNFKIPYSKITAVKSKLL